MLLVLTLHTHRQLDGYLDKVVVLGGGGGGRGSSRLHHNGWPEA